MQRAYDLRLTATPAIIGLPEVCNGDLPDVALNFVAPSSHGPDQLAPARSIVYPDGVAAWVNTALNRIDIYTPPGSTFEDVCTYIQGPLLGLFAQLRGAPVLHACAIVLNKKAIAFAGEATIGKSTLAAVWALSGCNVLSDDVCVCLQLDDQINVPSGCFHLRLWPESAKMLFGHEDALPLIAPPWPKRRLDLMAMGRFQTEPAPLGVIYAMEPAPDENADVSIKPLHGHAALMALLKNSYGIHRLNSAQRANELKKMSALADQIPVYRLLVPQTADRAFRIRDVILNRHV